MSPCKQLSILWIGLAVGASGFAQSTARVERSPSGVLVMRGSRPAPPAETAGEPTDPAAAGEKQPETPARAAARLLRDSGDVSYLSGDGTTDAILGSTESSYREYSSSGDFVPADTTRTTTRRLSDGTIETVATVWITDVNGREQMVRKSTTRAKTVGNSTTTVQTTEGPSINGGFRTVEKVSTVSTDHGDQGETVDKVIYTNTGVSNGLSEIGREHSVMRQTERGATTETTIYTRSLVNGKTEMTGRKIGRITEDEDGSVRETIEIYGRLGGTDFRTQRLARVTEDGFVEITTYDQNALGQMYAKGVSVEPLETRP